MQTSIKECTQDDLCASCFTFAFLNTVFPQLRKTLTPKCEVLSELKCRGEAECLFYRYFHNERTRYGLFITVSGLLISPSTGQSLQEVARLCECHNMAIIHPISSTNQYVSDCDISPCAWRDGSVWVVCKCVTLPLAKGDVWPCIIKCVCEWTIGRC